MMKLLKKLFLVLCLVFGINYLLSSQVLIPQNSKLLQSIISSRYSYAEILSDGWERSFDEVEWTSVSVPNSFANKDKIIYKKIHKLKIPNYDSYVWQLYFLGVEDEIDVELNGVFIGKYFGAMTPFTVKLPSRYITSPNLEIKLTITASKSLSRIVKEQNFCHPRNYIGILREVILLGTPNIWVNNVINKVKYNSASRSFNVNSSVSISSEDVKKFLVGVHRDSTRAYSSSVVNITVENFIRAKETNAIVGYSNAQQVAVSAERTINLNYNFTLSNVTLWTIDNPYEYENVVRILYNGVPVDEYVLPIGLNQFESRNNRFYLNGEPFDIKGVAYIEDHYLYAQSLSMEQYEQDIRSIKMLGANAIMFKYKIPHPYLVDLCSKNGLLAFIELPVNNFPSHILVSEEILVRMRNIADRIITYYSSQTAIAGWGIFAGLQDNKEDINTFTGDIYGLFKKSSNKLIYKTLSIFEKDIDVTNCDFLVLDGEKQPRSFAELKVHIAKHRELTHTIPVLFYFGFLVQPNNHGGFSDKLSLESQAHLIENIYILLNDLLISGNFVYAYNDYELQNPVLLTNLEDKYLCSWGITDRSRNHRVSYQTLKAMFNKEKAPLLDAGNFVPYTPNSFIILGLILCLILLFLLNRFRKFREYLVRALLRPYNFYADIRDQRITPTLQSFVLALVMSVTLSLYIVSLIYHYRDNFVVQILIGLLIQNNSWREVVYSAVWMPELFVFLLSLIVLIKLFVVAFILKLFSYLVAPKIFYGDTFVMTIWTGIPILILLPIAVILSKLLLLTEGLTVWIVSLFIVIIIWALFRLIKATSVVFDVRLSKAFIVGGAFIIVVSAIFVSIYQINFAFLDYVGYYFHYLLIS